MPRKPATKKISIDTLAQHMTTELEILNQSADHSREMLMNKVNFFLILVTAIGGGLALMVSVDVLRNLIIPTASVVILILIIMGFNTLRQGLDLSASAVTFYRRAGRIRRWYIDQEPSIEPYLPFNVADNLPRMSSNFINLRGAESILLLMNGSLCGILVGLIVAFVDSYIFHKVPAVSLALDFIIILAPGLVTIWLAWVLQVKYVKRFMRKWEMRQEKLKLIHFPDKLISEDDFEKILKETS